MGRNAESCIAIQRRENCRVFRRASRRCPHNFLPEFISAKKESAALVSAAFLFQNASQHVHNQQSNSFSSSRKDNFFDVLHSVLLPGKFCPGTFIGLTGRRSLRKKNYLGRIENVFRESAGGVFLQSLIVLLNLGLLNRTGRPKKQ